MDKFQMLGSKADNQSTYVQSPNTVAGAIPTSGEQTGRAAADSQAKREAETAVVIQGDDQFFLTGVNV